MLRHVQVLLFFVDFTSSFHYKNLNPVNTDRSLCFEEAADAVLQLVEEHGVESRAQLQAHQVLDGVVDLHALFVAAHHEREQPVQELTEWCLGVALT